ncbi:MotA/TolQ/ExbB proton channel family protein [Sphingomonas sp.]|uniref:MotA/TolQ/ExbB proton channel family protein n=1 Tax=Sphingomonas sp. TaxID=28214 RepID=UPI003B3AA4B0
MTTPAPGAAAPESNPYGLMAALEQGGTIAWTIFIILVIMSAASWYITISKLLEQQKILNQARRVRTSFWGTPTLKEGANKLERNSAYRQIVDDSLRAQDEHTKLIDPVDQHEWLGGSLARSQAAINSKLGSGLAVLATVGSTAPFVGLLGTVIGIYRALVKIGAAGQASIDAVAGPVGEALIMTAIGLVVAVPAVLGYNWLIRRNKMIAEQLSNFSTDVHGYLVSNGALKPQLTAKAAAPTPPLKTGSAAINPKA